MQKIISFIVPCYNSSEYMVRALDTLLAKRDAEVIIVNDGSTDNTLEVANLYQKKHSFMVKVIDKKNGGHGSAINAGLKAATGKYVKVVDSDDWLDFESLKKTIKILKRVDVDMLITNYVYEKEGKAKVMDYTANIPEDVIFTWGDVKKFKPSEYLLMHSVIYRTSLLRECKLMLPEHTFYVDNIFVYYPLKYVKTMYYYNVPLYRYFIGRKDQSVNEKVMISRVDQQLFVTKTMLDFFNPFDIDNLNLREYLIHYLDIMMSVSTILLQLSNSKAAKEKLKDLWDYVDKLYPNLHKEFKVAHLAKMPKIISVPGYKIARKVYQFN